MNNRFLWALPAVLLAAASCQEKEEAVYDGSPVVRTVECELPSGVSTASVYYNSWYGNLENQYQGGVAKPVELAGEIVHPGAEAVSSYNYYVIAPHHESSASGVIGGTTKIMERMFAVQYPSASAVDPLYDYKIAAPVLDAGIGKKISVSGFVPITATLAVKFEDPESLMGGETLRSASVSFEDLENPLTGIFFVQYGATMEESGICGVEKATAGTELTAFYPKGLAYSSGYGVMYSCIPAPIPSGTAIKARVTTDRRSLTFTTTLESALNLTAGARSEMTLRLKESAGETVKESYVQDFSAVPYVITNAQTTAAGDQYNWYFSNITRRASSYGLPNALKMCQNSVITLPAVPGKHYTAIRIYANENTYSSVTRPATVTTLDNGAEDIIRQFGPYCEGIRQGGYLEIGGLDTYSALAFNVTFNDSGKSHQMLFSAIEAELADGEVKPSGPGEGVVDYYELYNAGEDIINADGVVVNKAAYGEAVLATPEELNYDYIRNAKGVVFIDDLPGVSVDLGAGTATTKDVGGKGDFVLAGRYGGTGRQTNLKVIELRQNHEESWTFFNIKLTSIGITQYGFARNSSNGNSGEINFVDCFLDYSSPTFTQSTFALFWLSNATSGYFSAVRFINSVVRMTSKSGKIANLFYNNKTRNLGEERIVIDNSVIYTDALISGAIAALTTTSSSFLTSKLSLSVKNSTFANFYNVNSIVLAESLAGFEMSGNVFYLDYSGTSNSTTKAFWLKTGTSDDNLYRMTGNRFFRMGAGANNVWTPVNTTSAVKPFQEDNELVDGNPFLSMDYDHGYLPVNTAAVGAAYGATYDTKTFVRSGE